MLDLFTHNKFILGEAGESRDKDKRKMKKPDTKIEEVYMAISGTLVVLVSYEIYVSNLKKPYWFAQPDNP